MTNKLHSDIDAANERFMEAFRQCDADALATLYTSNGQLLPPQSDFVTGPEAIRSFWQSVFEVGLKEARLATVELEGLGDTAIEVGKYTLLAAQGEVADVGKYVVIWKQDDGAWKLHRDVWNSSQEVVPPA